MHFLLLHVVNIFVLGILLFLAGHSLRRHYLIGRLFARGTMVGNSIIDPILETINRESKVYLFSATKVTSLVLNNKNFYIIYGKETYTSADRYGLKTNSSLFTVIKSTEYHWIENQRHIFTPAFRGSEWSVFWVDPTKIKI